MRDEDAGQLGCCRGPPCMCANHRFDQDAMLASVERAHPVGRTCRLPAKQLRLVGHQWSVVSNQSPGTTCCLRARLNDVLSKSTLRCLQLRTYPKLSASVAMDIMPTHPRVIVSAGLLRANPFFRSTGRIPSLDTGATSAHGRTGLQPDRCPRIPILTFLSLLRCSGSLALLASP